MDVVHGNRRPWFNELCTQHGLAAEADALSALLRPSLGFAPV